MAIRFDAQNEYLYRDTGLPSYNAAYSGQVRVCLSSDLNNYQRFFALTASSDLSSAANCEFIGTDEDGTTSRINAFSGGTDGPQTSDSLTVGQWYSIGWVRESATALKLYIDGTYKVTVTTNVAGRTAAVKALIGGLLTNGYADFKCEGFKEWSVALSATEMATEAPYLLAIRRTDLLTETPLNAGTLSDALISTVGTNWSSAGSPTVETGSGARWRPGIPLSDELSTLDWAFGAEPFTQIALPGPATASLNWAFGAEPFYGVPPLRLVGTGSKIYGAQTPGTVGVDGPFELAVRFQANTSGQITAIRFWKDTNDSGDYIGHVWSSAGTELARVHFGVLDTGVSGWQEAALPTPLTLTAYAHYLVSVNCNYRVPYTSGQLTYPFNNGNLFALRGHTHGRNNIDVYPSAFDFTDGYFRDVLFTANAAENFLITTQLPGSVGSNGPYEFGIKFQANTTGQITKLRFWKPWDDSVSGDYVGRIWNAAGTQELANVTFASTTSVGWQVATLATPLNISANTDYWVSYNCGTKPPYTSGGLASSFSNGALTASDAAYGTAGSFPGTTTDDLVFIDPVFVAGAAPILLVARQFGSSLLWVC